MENYIPIYPSIEDPNIQRIISSKKEFIELLPDKEEKVVRRGKKSLNRQKLFARLTRLGDYMLNIHGTGSGKTCGFIEAAEQYKDSGAYDKVIIVEKNEGLINVIKEQIINTCATKDQYYMTNIQQDQITQRIKRKRENESLNKWYTFKTYGGFVNELNEMSNELLRSKYSHKIFIFDEAHNIIGPEEDAVTSKNKKFYPEIFRLTHATVNSKFILVTATPMINKVKEIAKLFNLFRPENNQIKLKNKYSLEEVESFARGKVSYYKAGSPEIDTNYIGTPLTFDDPSTGIELTFNMYLSKLGDLQERSYKEIVSKAFFSEENSAFTMVFPIINDIETTDSDYIEEIEGNLRWKKNPFFLEWSERGNALSFEEWLKDKNNLRRLSGKIAEIIDIETSNEGCSFIYSFDVNKSGVNIIERILSLYGFEQFTENSTDNIFIQGNNTKIRTSFKKKKRVAIITGQTSSNRQNAILELFKSPENVNGEYIKILIGSSRVRDGISVYHCQRMHLLRPHWNFSGMIQSINRVLRVTGHDDLKAYKIKKAKELGYIEGTEEYNNYTKIEVNIYRHCSDYNLDENIRGISRNNSDYQTMKIAVSKEIQINDVMDSLKICALDAHINRSANELSLSDPFNHRKVKFLPTWTEIQDPNYVFLKSDPIDYSTYNIIYMNIDRLVLYIKNILKENGSISYNNIFDRFNNKYTLEQIFEAIIKLKRENRYICKNYDQNMNIEIGPNGIYIQRTSNSKDNRFIHDISLYDSNPVVVYQNNPLKYLDKIKNDVMIRKVKEFIYDIDKINNNKKVYSDKILYIKNLSIWEKIYFLENLYLTKHDIFNIFENLNNNEISSLVLLFKGYTFEIKDEENNKYYVHTMSTSENESSHNISSRHKEPKYLKIFSPSEGFIGWRTPIDKEYNYFILEIKKIIENDMKKYENNDVYGTILKDGVFRLIENFINIEDTYDKRLGKTGKEPKSYMKKDKIKIAVHERIYPNKKCQEKKYNKQDIKNIREKISKDISKEYNDSIDDEQVMIYDIWTSCSNVDSYFQTEIIKKLQNDNRIYKPYIITEIN